MFLMNTSPLVALQRKWEPFAQSRSCRYPICFSESEDDLSRATVSAKVQMIINNLQSEESSLRSNDEFGRIGQKRRKGAKGRDHKDKGNGRMLQEDMEYTQHNCPADSDGMEVEESSEFGPLLVNSDSDDSVDRDIEAAIQEYLKTKGQSVQPLPCSVKSLPGPDGDHGGQQEHPSHDAADHFVPASVKAEVIQQPFTPDYLGDGGVQLASSPCSVSSDDSFEQSIKAEIEQFLNEKRRQAGEKQMTGGNKRLPQKETHEKSAVRSRKEGTARANRSSLRRGGKALSFRQHPELQNGSAPPERLKSKADEDVADFKKANQAPLSGHSCLQEQSKEGEIKPKLWETKGEERLERRELSDSSSDDGIEEAIQLYQLEKIRKEASKTGGVSFRNDEFGASRVANISASLTIRSVKSALPDIPRRALRSKRKRISSGPTELNRIGAVCDEPEKGRSSVAPANSFAKCAVTFQASCRADTAAELMCAEAILDISKTILPPPAGSDKRSLATDPFPCSRSMPPSQHESDRNAVDSDDSIEQEIRTFLALKAQTEGLIAKSEEAAHAVQMPPSSGQSDDQNRSPKHAAHKRLKQPLSCKKNPKRENKVSRQSQDQHVLWSSAVGYNHADSNNIHSKLVSSQKEDGASIPAKGQTAEAERHPPGPRAAVGSVDFASSLSQELLAAEELMESAPHTQRESGAGDKSSSLDSDEDLDTAIKDLLRSKRKLKKKTKDQRLQCKKKVQFGATEMHIFEDNLCRRQGRDCKSEPHTVLKSCLTRSRVGEANVKKGPQKPKSAATIQCALECKKACQPKSEPGNPEPARNDQCPWIATSLTDDSSSVDSDDSIEEEIQRFLAEKGQGSAGAVERPGAGKLVETLRVAKPQSDLLKAKRQPRGGRGGALSKQGVKGKKAGPGGDPPRKSEQARWYAGRTCSQPVVKFQANPEVVEAEGACSSVKRTAGTRQGVCDGKLGQRSPPSEKDKAENCKRSPHSFKPLSSFKRKSPYEFKISSKFIAGLRRARNKKKAVLLGNTQSLELSVFKKRQGGILAASLFSERCEAVLQKGSLGSRRETGGSKAARPPRSTAEALHCSASERHEKTQVPPFSLAQINPTRDREPCLSADVSHGRPLQEPDMHDRREAKVSTGCLHAEVALKEEEGKAQEPLTSQEERKVPNSPVHFPWLNENALSHQERLAETETQKGLAEGSAEFTDISVVMHTQPLAKSKASSFLLSTSIDPGWTVSPCIVLSPAELCESKALEMQSRRKALQILAEKARWNSRRKELAEQ